MENINCHKAKELIKKNDVILLDVRTKNEYDNRHAEGALNIDYMSSDFEEKIEKLDKSKKYILYCRSGARSGSAGMIMEKKGFKVYNVVECISKLF